MITQLTVEGNKTTAMVVAEPGTLLEGLGLVGFGSARCRPDDFYLRTVGETIALGRAIQDFGKKLEEMGSEGSISNADVDRVNEAMAIRAIDSIRKG